MAVGAGERSDGDEGDRRERGHPELRPPAVEAGAGVGARVAGEVGEACVDPEQVFRLRRLDQIEVAGEVCADPAAWSAFKDKVHGLDRAATSATDRQRSYSVST